MARSDEGLEMKRVSGKVVAILLVGASVIAIASLLLVSHSSWSRSFYFERILKEGANHISLDLPHGRYLLVISEKRKYPEPYLRGFSVTGKVATSSKEWAVDETVDPTDITNETHVYRWFVVDRTRDQVVLSIDLREATDAGTPIYLVIYQPLKSSEKRDDSCPPEQCYPNHSGPATIPPMVSRWIGACFHLSRRLREFA